MPNRYGRNSIGGADMSMRRSRGVPSVAPVAATEPAGPPDGPATQIGFVNARADERMAFLNRRVDDVDDRLVAVMVEQNARHGQRFDALERAIGVAEETARAEMRALRDLLDERDRRYESMMDALTERITAAIVIGESRSNERDLRYEQRYDSQQQSLTNALNAAKEAVLKAELASEKRFESVNEFRGQLADQANTFLTRVEFMQQAKASDDKIDALTRVIDRTEGRGDNSHIDSLTTQVGALTQSMHEGAGRYQQREQVSATAGLSIQTIMALVGILGFAVVVFQLLQAR